MRHFVAWEFDTISKHDDKSFVVSYARKDGWSALSICFMYTRGWKRDENDDDEDPSEGSETENFLSGLLRSLSEFFNLAKTFW